MTLLAVDFFGDDKKSAVLRVSTTAPERASEDEGEVEGAGVVEEAEAKAEEVDAADTTGATRDGGALGCGFAKTWSVALDCVEPSELLVLALVEYRSGAETSEEEVAPAAEEEGDGEAAGAAKREGKLAIGD